MNPARILKEIKKVGVILAISPAGRIKVSGERGNVNSLISIIRDNKPELIKLLLQTSGNSQCHDQTVPRRRGWISPVALGWLKKHRQVLKQAGWTSPELYRRNKSRGLAWLLIWDRPGLDILLSNNGGIVFQYVNETGTAIAQTAFPRRNNYGIRH